MAEERPLIYVDSWKKAPYAFINDKGESDGFCVELVKKMMARLSIPCEIRLCSQQKSRDLIKKDSADITCGLAVNMNAPYGNFGKETICLFENAMLVKKGDSTSMIPIQQLRAMPVTVKKDSRVHLYLLDKGMPDSLITTVDNVEAEVLRQATNGHVNVLWNTMMLRWILDKYHLTDRYTIQPVEITPGEYRFMSSDTVLLARMDSVLRTMKQSGELHEMAERWMTTKTTEKKSWFTNRVLLSAISGSIVLLIIVIVVRWYRRRQSRNDLFDTKTLMSLTLHANHMQVWVYYPLTRRYAWMTHDGVAQKQYNSFEFSKFYPEKDFNIIHSQVMEFLSKDTQPVTKLVHSYDITNKEHILDVEVRMEALYDSYGKIYLICGVQYDVTDSKAALTRMRQMHDRYRTAFNIAFGTFIRFDAEGYLVDINQEFCWKFNIDDPQKLIGKKYNIHDFGMLRDVDLDSCPDDTTFYTLSKNAIRRKFVPEDRLHRHAFKYDNHFNEHMGAEQDHSLSDDMYYFTHLIKSYDMTGKLIGYIMYMEDRTQNVELFEHNRRREQQAMKLETEADMVASRRNFLIESSDISMVHYYPDTKTFKVYEHEKGWEKTLTQLDILERVEPQNMPKIFKILHKVDARVKEDIHFSVSTMLRNEKDEMIHFNVDAHPVYGDDGNVECYFGVMRDITNQLSIHQRLRRETKRAREAERLQQNFLKNMSYSIRQPIIIIQQNIELFVKAEDNLIMQSSLTNITSSTRRLITLSDDTLLLSRVEAGLLTENKERTDLVPLFHKVINDSIDEYRRKTVKYNVSESYETLSCFADTTIISRILHEVVSLSARHTSYGILSVRYMYRKGNVSIFVESTGQSISPNMLQHLYEPRIGDAYTTDMQNLRLSGLEMPICKALIDMLHGSIDIESDHSRGTSIYVNIPIEE